MSNEYYNEICSPRIDEEIIIPLHKNNEIEYVIIRGITYKCGAFINIRFQQKEQVIGKILKIIKGISGMKFECQILRVTYSKTLNGYQLISDGGRQRIQTVDPMHLKSPFPIWDYKRNDDIIILGKCLF
jgi:hypothetical protein